MSEKKHPDNLKTKTIGVYVSKEFYLEIVRFCNETFKK
jgi:hypothetical protein